MHNRIDCPFAADHHGPCVNPSEARIRTVDREGRIRTDSLQNFAHDHAAPGNLLRVYEHYRAFRNVGDTATKFEYTATRVK